MRARILAADTTGFYGQLLNGFSLYSRSVRERLGLAPEIEAFSSLSDLARGLERAREEIVFVMPCFLQSGEDLAEILARNREQRPEVFAVLLDGHDQTSSPHFPVLPHVDRYVKSKVLRQIEDYQRDYRGGYVFADFYSRTYDFDLADWTFGSKPAPLLVEKIVPGWNFGVTRRIRWLVRVNRRLPKPLTARRYDLGARFAARMPADRPEWYHDYRARIAETVAAAGRGVRMTPPGRIGDLAFLRELRQCRIIFSPFGWGEVCMRDYEAVASGCLLVKPDCGHLATSPNIFVDGETYVAVRWDLSDLEAKIAHYLARPDEAQRIATRGIEVLSDYFERGGFVDDLARALPCDR